MYLAFVRANCEINLTENHRRPQPMKNDLLYMYESLVLIGSYSPIAETCTSIINGVI